jgi:hypothetical protein
MWAHRTNSIRREACCRITRTASLAVSAGTARITATYQGKVGSFGVLAQTSIASIAVSGVTSLTALGSASQLTATASMDGGSTQSVTALTTRQSKSHWSTPNVSSTARTPPLGHTSDDGRRAVRPVRSVPRSSRCGEGL